MIVFLLVLAILQTDPEDLVRRLGDDSIEARERAAAELLKIGEPARAALAKAGSSTDPEIKARSSAILAALDLRRELRAWIGEPIKINVSGQLTLKEAVELFEKQSGVKVAADEWPDGRFAADVKDAPLWEALEAICKASGKRTLSLTPEGPKLIGKKWVEVPSVSMRNCVVRFDSVKTLRTRYFEADSSVRLFTIGFMAGWAKPLSMARSTLNLTVVEDDQGMSLLDGFAQMENRMSYGRPFGATEPGPVVASSFWKTTNEPPLPIASRLRKVEGKILIWVRAGPGDLEIPLAGAGSDRVEIAGPDLSVTGTVEVTLNSSVRKGSTLTCALYFEGFEEWMFRGPENPWAVKDKDGRTYEGVNRSRQWISRSQGFTVEFRDLPKEVVPVSLVIRIPRKVVSIEVPFALRDIPLK